MAVATHTHTLTFNGSVITLMDSTQPQCPLAKTLIIWQHEGRTKKKKKEIIFRSQFFFSIHGANILTMLSMCFKILAVTSDLAGEQRACAGLKRNRAGVGSDPL